MTLPDLLRMKDTCKADGKQVAHTSGMLTMLES
jgi:hypothetical protein